MKLNFSKSLFRVFCVSSFLALGVPHGAQAGVNIFLDPYVGWTLLGEASQVSATSSIPAGNYNGLGLGTRVGLTFMGGVFAALDYSYHPSINISSNSASYIDSGASLSRLGAVVGMSLPILPLRFWVGYNFMDKISDTFQGTSGAVSSGVPVSFSGYGYKVGVGLTTFPLVSLNAEYYWSKYNNLSLSGVATPLTTFDHYELDALMLSASFPFSLAY